MYCTKVYCRVGRVVNGDKVEIWASRLLNYLKKRNLDGRSRKTLKLISTTRVHNDHQKLELFCNSFKNFFIFIN